jgi:hypothetical protein
MHRLDALLAELAARHGNQDPRFLAAVRPLAERILDPALPAGARVSLLEKLAETFERDAQVRRDMARLRADLAQWFADLKRLLGLP